MSFVNLMIWILSYYFDENCSRGNDFWEDTLESFKWVSNTKNTLNMWKIFNSYNIFYFFGFIDKNKNQNKLTLLKENVEMSWFYNKLIVFFKIRKNKHCVTKNLNLKLSWKFSFQFIFDFYFLTVQIYLWVSILFLI